MPAECALAKIGHLHELARLFPMAKDLFGNLFQKDERIQVQADAQGAHLVVTDRRLAVVSRPARPDLDIPFEALRRIQFDIERERPATLVIVPEHPDNHPQVLAIPPDQYAAVGQALAAIGHRLAGVSSEEAST